MIININKNLDQDIFVNVDNHIILQCLANTIYPEPSIFYQQEQELADCVPALTHQRWLYRKSTFVAIMNNKGIDNKLFDNKISSIYFSTSDYIMSDV